MKLAKLCRKIGGRIYRRVILGQRLELGHGFERQVASRLIGIRKDHRQRYDFAISLMNASKLNVLDLACGVGYGTFMMGKAIKRAQVLGCDIDSNSINFAEKHFNLPNVSYLCENACSVSFKKKFNFIVSFETLEHIEDEDLFLQKLREVATKDCLLVISTPNELRYKFSPIRNPYHVRHHTPEEFESVLSKNGWEVKDYFCQKSSRNGKVHAGKKGGFLIYIAKPKNDN